jgi:hypothetical protein
VNPRCWHGPYTALAHSDPCGGAPASMWFCDSLLRCISWSPSWSLSSSLCVLERLLWKFRSTPWATVPWPFRWCTFFFLCVAAGKGQGKRLSENQILLGLDL